MKTIEVAWLVSAIAAIVVGAYNLSMVQAIKPEVYFPFLVSIMCALMYLNVKKQRQFKEKLQQKNHNQ